MENQRIQIKGNRDLEPFLLYDLIELAVAKFGDVTVINSEYRKLANKYEKENISFVRKDWEDACIFTYKDVSVNFTDSHQFTSKITLELYQLHD